MTGPRTQLSMGVISFAAEDPGSWGALMERARLLDSAGVDRLVVSDHVVFGERLDRYGRPELGGQVGGRQPTGPDGHWLEPLTALSYIAAITTRIRLGTNVLLAALRRPVVLAKTVATLDVLSGGRLDLGVGVGWQREEYDAAGLDFERRGQLLDHTLEVCRTLWSEPRASYDTPEVRFDAIHMMPKPVRGGEMPVWVSGTVNPRVARRIARFGSGWIPWGPAASDIASGITQMHDLLTAYDFDASALQIVGQLETVRRDDRSVDIERTMAGVASLVEAGVTDVRTTVSVPSDAGAAHDFVHDLVEAFRRSTSYPS